jgi:hypothetical protein
VLVTWPVTAMWPYSMVMACIAPIDFPVGLSLFCAGCNPDTQCAGACACRSNKHNVCINVFNTVYITMRVHRVACVS